MTRWGILLALLACTGGDTDVGGSGPPVASNPGLNEAVAGIIEDQDLLIGGSAAEGQVGDYLLANAQVRAVIQGIRPGDYYQQTGGVLIDMDIARPPTEADRDVIDELLLMPNIGWVMQPHEITASGKGAVATLRVEGRLAPLDILNGALETEDFVSPPEASFVTEYQLAAGSPWIEVRTAVVWQDSAQDIMPVDAILYGQEGAQMVGSTFGLGTPSEWDGRWFGTLSHSSDAAIVIHYVDQPFETSGAGQILSAAGPIVSGFYPSRPIDIDGTHQWTRRIAAGRDVASAIDSLSTAPEQSGTVEVAGRPVPGVKVWLLDSAGGVLNQATTRADGRWTARAENVAATYMVGEARGVFGGDLPTRGWFPPMGTAFMQARSFQRSGESLANGYGYGPVVDGEYALVEPATLTVNANVPALVEVRKQSAWDVPERLDSGRPDGRWALGSTAGGSVEIPLSPGTYDVLVHHGARYSYHAQTVDLAAGGATTMDVQLDPAWSDDNVRSWDVHTHASPSNDGRVTMAERVLFSDAAGIDVHFGTDHDAVGDYRPIVDDLGLASGTIVGAEVSPVLYGHQNVFPVEPQPAAVNRGAPAWWTDWLVWEDAEGMRAAIRSAFGDIAIQLNHPRDSGALSAADFEPGEGSIRNRHRWSADFDAIELMNAGEWRKNFADYLDFSSRGASVAAMGSSDAHGFLSDMGSSFTWVHTGGAVLDNAAVRDAVARRETVVSTTPFLKVTVDGEWAPGRTFSGAPTATVDVLAPDWAVVDTIEIYKNSELYRTVAWDGTALEIALDDPSDASWVIVATGSARMAPVFPGETPSAIASAIYTDVAGDGWQAPLQPPLESL